MAELGSSTSVFVWLYYLLYWVLVSSVVMLRAMLDFLMAFPLLKQFGVLKLYLSASVSFLLAQIIVQ